MSLWSMCRYTWRWSSSINLKIYKRILCFYSFNCYLVTGGGDGRAGARAEDLPWRGIFEILSSNEENMIKLLQKYFW